MLVIFLDKIVSSFSANMVSIVYAKTLIEPSSNKVGKENSISLGVMISPVVTSTVKGTLMGV